MNSLLVLILIGSVQFVKPWGVGVYGSWIGVDIFGKTFEKMKVKNQVLYNEQRFENDETYFPFLGVFLLSSG